VDTFIQEDVIRLEDNFEMKITDTNLQNITIARKWQFTDLRPIKIIHQKIYVEQPVRNKVFIGAMTGFSQTKADIAGGKLWDGIQFGPEISLLTKRENLFDLSSDFTTGFDNIQFSFKTKLSFRKKK
jgi:hypothetical protein